MGRKLANYGLMAAALLMISACGGGNTPVTDGGDGDGGGGGCEANAECDDGEACNGEETCASGICLPGTGLDDGTACGTGDDVCAGGVCVSSLCGNGDVDPGEACEDGNTVNGDGCDNDCTFSCQTDAECADVEYCNGSETCDQASHTCSSSGGVADGTECQVDGESGLCASGACQPSVCGDGHADPDEACDDGNEVPGDGCEGDCTFTCEVNDDCLDSNPCNGSETCNPNTHLCSPANANIGNGTLCTMQGLTGTGYCTDGLCLPSRCGDGFVDAATEDCEDGNQDEGDGCDNDCTWSCTDAAECDDANVCTTGESCDLAAHVCAAGSPVAQGTVCGTDLECYDGVCRSGTCGDGTVGAGEDCDGGTGCKADCTWICESNGDCDDGNACTTGETCNLANHTCSAGTVVACGDSNPCTADSCNPAIGCVNTVVDGDGDGVLCGTDCDDTNTTVKGPLSWYADCDTDNYAATGAQTTAACAVPTSAPTACTTGGWTTRAPTNTTDTDCRDTISSFNPAAQWHDVGYCSRFPCLPAWDYNCSNAVEKRWTAVNVSTRASCTQGLRYICVGTSGWMGGTVPDCGVTGDLTSCELDMTLNCVRRNYLTKKQECR